MLKKFSLFIIFSIYTYSQVFAQLNCENPRNLQEIISCDYAKYLEGFGVPPIGRCEQLIGNEKAKTYLAGWKRKSSSFPGLNDSFNKRCNNFIKQDGSFGSYGETVEKYISDTNVSSLFLNENLPYIADACPRWYKLNDDERKFFWVWTFASIAHDESSCDPNARNSKASDGTAVGLLQMNETKKHRSWRGPNCKVASVTGASENLLCGLDIMAELLRGKNGVYKSNGAIFRNGRRNTSYWEKLKRPDGGRVGKLIKSNPLCQDTSV
jgi:hypothetical protein